MDERLSKIGSDVGVLKGEVGGAQGRICGVAAAARSGGAVVGRCGGEKVAPGRV